MVENSPNLLKHVDIKVLKHLKPDMTTEGFLHVILELKCQEASQRTVKVSISTKFLVKVNLSE
jgi:hypothetical protein